MKKYLFFTGAYLILLVGLLLGGCTHYVVWVGHPVVDKGSWLDAAYSSQSWLPGICLGLRQDGVVVWKETKGIVDKCQ